MARTRKTDPQPELDADTESRLLEAAGRIFADKGFDGATVREVCEAAGVKNIGAVNYYFRSKDKLYEAAVRHAFRCRLARTPFPVWPEGMSPVAKLRQFIRGAVRAMLEDFDAPWQMRLLMRELAVPGPAGEGLVRDFIRPVYEHLWQILRDVLPPATDERKLHLIAFSIMGQCFYQRIGRQVIRRLVGEEEQASYTPEALAEHIADFSLKALGLDSTEGGTP